MSQTAQSRGPLTTQVATDHRRRLGQLHRVHAIVIIPEAALGRPLTSRHGWRRLPEPTTTTLVILGDVRKVALGLLIPWRAALGRA